MTQAGRFALLWLVAVVVGAQARAAAADEPTAGDAPATTAYPRALIARPLVLPSGMLEARADVILDHYKSGDFDVTERAVAPGVRAALGGTELAAAVRLFLGQSDRSDPPLAEPPRVETLDLAVRLRILSDAYLGLELTSIWPGQPYSAYEPTVTFFYKAHPESKAAPVVGGRAGLTLVDDQEGPTPETRSYLFLEGVGRAQTQLAPSVGLEGELRLHYQRRTGYEPEPGESIANLTVAVGARAVAALTPQLDVVASADLQSQGTRLFVVGLAARSRP